MKNKIFTLLFTILLGTNAAFSVEIGNLIYDLQTDKTTGYYYATVIGTVTHNMTSVSIPASIVYDNKTYHVTDINDAFRNCEYLTSVTLPSSIINVFPYTFIEDNISEIHFDGTLNEWCRKLFEVDYVSNNYSLYIGNDLIVNLIIPDDITDVGGNYGGLAFKNCNSLNSVTFSENVKNIGPEAFSNCKNLKTVTIPEGVTNIGGGAFQDCSSLVSIVIPNSVTELGGSVCRNCTNLTSAIIGNGVKTLSYNFYGCTNLASITIGEGVEKIGLETFSQCPNIDTIIYNAINCKNNGNMHFAFGACEQNVSSVTIGPKVQHIPQQLCQDFAKLKSIVIPNSVTKIDGAAFDDCSSLTSITIGNGVTYIGGDAFTGCNNLDTVRITDIGAWAEIEFSNKNSNPTLYAKDLYLNNEKLTNLVIPQGVSKIGNYAFINCNSLTSLTIPSSVKSIGIDAFSGCRSWTSVHVSDIGTWCELSFSKKDANPLYYSKKLYINNEEVTTINVPETVKKIGAYVFYDYDLLTSVTIGDSVKSIGDNAFYDCGSITNMTLGSSIKTIGEKAFYNCSNISTPIVISDSVATIKASAFQKCKNIPSFTIGKNVSTIGANAFFECNNCKAVYISDLAAWCKIGFGSDGATPVYHPGKLYLNDELLTDVVIPDEITELKAYAFAYCGCMNSVVINDNVTSIPKRAFYGTGLKSVIIGNSVQKIGEEAFESSSITSNVIIPNSVTEIGKEAFRTCSIPNLIIGSRLKTIGSEAITGCLDSILVAEDNPNFCSIEGVMYSKDTTRLVRCPKQMQRLIIPNTVKNIGTYGLANCTKFISIICNAVTPPTIGSQGLYYVPKTVPLYVPAESVDAYKAATGWKDFNNISAISDTETTYYTVTFHDWDGTTLKTEQVEEGNAATAPADPTREGYTFTGWDKDFSNVTEDLTVTAQYKINRYEVQFLDWDKSVLKKDSVNHGEAAVAPSDPKREGYTFTGWDKDFSNVTEDLTVTAQYKINRYEVQFLDWDKSVLKKDSVNHGEAAVAPSDPKREGYYFIGWNKDFSAVIENMIITAQYEKEQEPEPQEPEIVITREILDLAADGKSIDDWTINDATLNESTTDLSKKMYVYDIKAGIPSISYITSKPRFQFQIGNASDKTKALYIHPGKCFEFGGKNGIINILNTAIGDTIKLEVAAKGSNMGNFEDPSAAYPINAIALTEDLTLPKKGSTGADNNGYIWRTLEYLSQGGDVAIRETDGGFRIRLAEVVHVESSIPTDIMSVEDHQGTLTRKLLRNGQIFINRGDKIYTITGQEVK